MSRFEKIQIILSAVTILVASIIGFQQNIINRNLLDLSYIPTVEIVYTDGQFRIINRGDKNIFVGSLILYDKFSGKGGIKSNNDVRLVAPDSFYYYEASFQTEPLKDILEKYRKEVGANGETSFQVDVLLKSVTEKKYIAKNILVITFKDDIPNIRTQTVAVIQDGW